MAGIYVHIPLCKSKCIYCGFYSRPLSLLKQPGGETVASALVGALVREIDARKNFLRKYSSGDYGELPEVAGEDFSEIINTIYFGGGTPSVLSISDLQRLVSALHSSFNISRDAEFTIEVNPDDVTFSYASALKEMGVNRISMGVQSFVDEHLKWMRRRHTAARAVEAFKILREAGFENISLDLIFGFKGLTNEQLELNLQKLTALSPEHISTYQLSIDPGTILEKLTEKGENFLLGDADCAAQYALIQKGLREYGYVQYEVSNFARGGMVSLHNSNYWKRVPYIGLGPGAHSFAGTHREWNNENIEEYIRYYSGGEGIAASGNNEVIAVSGSEELSAREVYTETVMLGLRRCEGVNAALLQKCAESAGIDLAQLENSIAEQITLGNLVRYNDERGESFIKIPAEKLFISDSIILKLL